MAFLHSVRRRLLVTANVFPSSPILVTRMVEARRSVRRLLFTVNVVPNSPSLVTLMKEALSSSETSVLIRATRRNIPEDAILHSHRHENLKSYLKILFNSLIASLIFSRRVWRLAQ
jgi:hypothetical protein